MVKAALAELESAYRRLGLSDEKLDQAIKLTRFVAHDHDQIRTSLDRIKQLLLAIDTDGVPTNGHGAAVSE